MGFTSGNATFFFGAGASAEFGIPTMQKMTSDFTAILDKEATSDEKTLYHEIVDNLRLDLGTEAVDIEAVMSVIEGLKDFNPDNLGELAIYTSRKLYQKPLYSPGLKPVYLQPSVITGLEQRFQQFIRRSCRIKTDRRSHVSEVYSDFFKKVMSMSGSHSLSPTGIPYVNSTLFTTNYDRCLEAFWREDAELDLHTGFDRSGSLLRMNTDSFVIPAGRLQLVKLHGSSTWLRNKRSGTITEEKFDQDQASEFGMSNNYQEVMIYPLGQKQLYVSPYIQLFERLNRDLEFKNHWLVVGYSFRDSVIRNIFSSKLGGNKRLILVHPQAEEIATRRFPNQLANIERVSVYFGRRDSYSAVNDAIVNVLRRIG